MYKSKEFFIYKSGQYGTYEVVPLQDSYLLTFTFSGDSMSKEYPNSMSQCEAKAELRRAFADMIFERRDAQADPDLEKKQ